MKRRSRYSLVDLAQDAADGRLVSRAGRYPSGWIKKDSKPVEPTPEVSSNELPTT